MKRKSYFKLKTRENETKNLQSLLLNNWEIKTKTLSSIEQGDSTNNWVVTSDADERYILRNAGNYNHYVRFQCDILRFLAKKKLPYEIPAPLSLKIGSGYVTDVDSDSFFLYKYINGETLHKISIVEAKEIGEMLATYHKYISSFKWEGYNQLRSKNLFEKEKNARFMMSSRRAVEAKKAKTDTDQSFLADFKKFYNFYIQILSSTDLGRYRSGKRIPCHGDLEKRNIIKRGDNIVGFIDLGGITIDPAICDLQSCIQLNSLGRGQLNKEIAQAILQGYTQKTDVKNVDLQFITPLMYADMLKTLCWILLDRSKDNSRIDEEEARQRINTLLWFMENFNDVKSWFV